MIESVNTYPQSHPHLGSARVKPPVFLIMEKNPNVKFLSIEELKSIVGSSEGRVLRNPGTGKLFLAMGSKSFKAQQSLDTSKPIAFLVEDGNIEDGCLVNTKPIETIFTF